MRKLSRRGFLRSGVSASAAVLIGCDGGQILVPAPETDTPPEAPLQVAPISVVRVGIAGLGVRGRNHLHMLQEIDGVEVKAVCDIESERIAAAQTHAQNVGQSEPAGFPHFSDMIANGNLDLVVIATPWEDHVPMCIAAMNAGMHTATEVPAATSIQDCWDIVTTAERNSRHCIMLENVNYSRSELTILNMVRQGVFGDVNYCEGSYEHDLRADRLDPMRHNPPFWRLKHAVRRNANLYPTHGLGPLANCLKINRGDRFCRLTALSSPSAGLKQFVEESLSPGSPYAGKEFACGDYVVALIHTKLGKAVYLTYNTSSPRPYSRRHLVQGGRGIFQGYPDRIHIDGQSMHGEWEDPGLYFLNYRPRLWTDWDAGQMNNFTTFGHGGFDNVMWYRLFHLLHNGLPMDMDVYDAAALSVVTELTEISIQYGGAAVEFPDFTRGRWTEWSPQDYGLS